MADLIDRAALLERIDAKFFATNPSGEEQLGYLGSRTIIRTAPAVDAVPVVYGEWVSSRFNATYGEYEEQCSCCKGWSLEYDKPYCPNCGAKMDGGKET